MALSFLKKGASPAPAQNQSAAPKPGLGTKFKPSPQGEAGTSSGPSFLKRGAAAKAALAEAQAQAELRRQQAGSMFEFYMKKGEDRIITFLDGDLDNEGSLDIFMYHQHTVPSGGNRFQTFICTRDVAGWCPICDTGDNPAFIGIMTVIDHTPYTVQSGPNAGKTVKNAKKLFPAKLGTLQLLHKKAVKYGGLSGCTFEVSRTDSRQSPRVGDVFDFDRKWEDGESLMEHFGIKEEEMLVPADYQKEIKYLTPEDIVKLGFGSMPSGPGFGEGESGASADYSSEL